MEVDFIHGVDLIKQFDEYICKNLAIEDKQKCGELLDSGFIGKVLFA